MLYFFSEGEGVIRYMTVNMFFNLEEEVGLFGGIGQSFF